jgi:hypothetical protein
VEQRVLVTVKDAICLEMEEFTEGLGEFIPHPVSIPALVEAANRLVEQDEPPRSAS